MGEFLAWLFSSDGFMPHGHCYLWRPELVWLHALSDGVIALAYATIPMSLGWLAWRRGDLRANWIVLSFGVFILACGATHVMEIINIWTPVYWLAGIIKVVTALASISTAIALVRLLPGLIALPSLGALSASNATLSREVHTQAIARAELKRANDELESRVAERTAELQALNHALTAEIAQREQAGRELTAQLVRLRLLQQITQATGERQDLRSIYQVVLATVEDHLPIDFGLICLHEPGGDVLSIASIGAKSQPLADALDLHLAGRIAIDQNGLARCTKGALVHEPDLTALDLPFARVLAGAGLHALVLAPLRVESRVFGVLVAARRDANSFSSGECEFLRQLCEQVALAAHQMQLYQALQQAYDEQRQTQAAVMQQERLRALGQMASGIAHDINNALTPVTLYTEYLLEREPELSKRARNYLGNIGRAVGDVAATIGRMREFYRQRESQAALTAVQLNELVAQVVDFTRARWHDMPQQRGVVINVVTELAPTPPTIPGLANELRDAFTNLIFNAVDALPDGGTITIRTSVIMRRPNTKSGPFPTMAGAVGAAAVEPAALPHQVQLTISDNGVGMSDEVRRRCMELFFTTKGERGTGLGLAMVYGAMQRHGAEIEIDSAPGRGTTVLMTFPLAGAASLAGANGAPAATGPLPSLRLLVIDDDPLLLAALTDILGADGHRITTADGGQAGINAFRAALAEGVPFAAVITDLGMPYIDGRRVATAVKAVAPDTPVLLLTGWGQRLAAEGDVPEGVDAVLSKPPKISELRAALSEHCRPR